MEFLFFPEEFFEAEFPEPFEFEFPDVPEPEGAVGELFDLFDELVFDLLERDELDGKVEVEDDFFEFLDDVEFEFF